MTLVFTRLKELWDASSGGAYTVEVGNGHWYRIRHEYVEYDSRQKQTALFGYDCPLNRCAQFNRQDAEFIAFAHNAVPAMLAEVERLQDIESRFTERKSALTMCESALELSTRENTELKAELEVWKQQCATSGEAIARLGYRLHKQGQAIKGTVHAVERLKSGVLYSDNPEWFDDVLTEANQILGGGDEKPLPGTISE